MVATRRSRTVSHRHARVGVLTDAHVVGVYDDLELEPLPLLDAVPPMHHCPCHLHVVTSLTHASAQCSTV